MYAYEDVEDFFWANYWGNGGLTLTGSYLEDQERFPGFRRDVNLYSALLNRKVKALRSYVEALKQSGGDDPKDIE